MSHRHSIGDPPGPFRPDQVRAGDRYEIDRGHPIQCAPTGGDGARSTLLGGQVLNSDPDVTEAGFDAGFVSSAHSMRAPDIAVGNVPDRAGWIPGVPPLAVEYAGSGQDEDALQSTIAEFLGHGTRWIWVVRLDTPRRVEIHAPGEPMTVRHVGEVLTAPGVLRNPVPVEALFDRRVANEVTFKNLLQQFGYASLDEVHDEGRAEGERRGREALLVEFYESRFGSLSPVVRAALADTTAERASALLRRALSCGTAEDAVADDAG
jgi:hypothetical protein